MQAFHKIKLTDTGGGELNTLKLNAQCIEFEKHHVKAWVSLLQAHMCYFLRIDFFMSPSLGEIKNLDKTVKHTEFYKYINCQYKFEIKISIQ